MPDVGGEAVDVLLLTVDRQREELSLRDPEVAVEPRFELGRLVLE